MKQPSNDLKKEFLDTFKRLSSTRHPRAVFNDFVAMAACALSNACDKSQSNRREEMYLNIASGYSSQEIETISELLALTTLALDKNSSQDFLGQILMELELGNARNGQFLTPYNISYMMSQLVGSTKEEFDKKKIITVSDCCCGTGGMLIAHANVAKEQDINYQRRVLYYAQDIDPTMAYACYIQLSLLGCMAQVAVGDALSKPYPDRESIWLTPFYIINRHLLCDEENATQQSYSGVNKHKHQEAPDYPNLFPSDEEFGFFLFKWKAS